MFTLGNPETEDPIYSVQELNISIPWFREVGWILEIGDWRFGGKNGACQSKICISNFYYQNQFER